MLHQKSRVDAAQVETLAARQHCHRHLADFSGGEDELGVRRRLLQRLEQRVEGRARQHVHFVEDVDLVARAHRRVADGIVDLPHVLDAVMRGGIHLQYVRMPALDDGLAVHAHHRHLDRRFFHRAVGQFVIERTRKNARGRRLSDAAHAGQDPGLRNAAALERVRDRAHHGVLPDQILEACGPVFACEHAVSIGRRLGRGGTGNGGFSGLAHRAIRFAAARRAD